MTGTRIVCMFAFIVKILVIELLCIFVRKLLSGAELKLIDLHGGFEFFAVDGEETLADGFLVVNLTLFHH